MKIKAKKSELVEALKKIYPLCSNSVQPILNNVLINADKTGIELVGHNLDISIKTSLKCEVLEVGSALFPASKLFQIVDTLSDDIEISDGLIQSGKTKIQLVSNEVKDYPTQLFNKEFDLDLTIDSEVLLTGIQKTISSTVQETMNILSGINLIISEDAINFYAGTGQICAHYFSEIKSDKTTDIILPSAISRELTRIFTGGYELILSISDNSILVSDNTTTIQSKLVNGQFPKMTHLFNAEKENTIAISKDSLNQIVKRCNILKTNDKKELTVLKFDVSGMATNVSYKNVLSETIITEKVGSDIVIGFDFNLLNVALKTIDDNTLRIQYSGDVQPALIQDGNYSFLIAPCKIKSA